MSIVQISKIQQRSGNLVDLPQLDEAEFGWASDAKKLYIGKTTPNENIEVLTSYSQINFSQINGTVGNINISNVNIANGQVLAYDGTNWVNRGGNAGGLLTFGDVSNVKITGGAIGYVLETDGTGNLSWTPKSTIIAYIENAAPTPINAGLNYALSTDGTTEIITLDANYSYIANTPVIFSGTGFGNISANTTYYIKTVVSNNEITISSTVGGSNVDLTTDTGNLTLQILGTVVTTTEDNFLTDGLATTVTGAVGMTELNGQTYYIDVLTANTFALYNDPGLTEVVDSTSYNAYAYTTVSATSTSTDQITVADATPFTINDPVVFAGNLGNSTIVTGQTYYIKTKDTSAPNTWITISETVGGNTFDPGTEASASGRVYATGGRVIATVGGSGSGNGAQGSTTSVQYNNSNLLDGDSNFTWDFGNLILNVNGNANVGNLNANGVATATRFISNIATGTSPLQVTSTTRVSNLNVSYSNVSDFEVVTAQNTGTFYPVFVNGATTANYALGSNANISFNAATGVLTTTGANVTGNLAANNGAISNLLTVGANANVTGNLNVTANIVGAANLSANNGAIGNLLTVGANANVAGNLNVTTNAVITANLSANNGAIGNLLTVGANANVAGNLNVVNNAVITANMSANNGAISNLLTVGANANVVGNLNVTSNIATNANLSANNGSISNFLSVGANANVTGNLNVTANANITANLSANNSAIGNLLTVGANANVTGNLNVTANANVTANVNANNVIASNLVSATLLTGTLTTAAQPNITSVGTLTSLAVTGNVTAGNVYANSGTIGASLLTGTLTTAAQPNITSTGTLTGLTVSGNVSFTGANVSLGSNSNVRITGGSSGQLLGTDGAGNLSWVNQGSIISGAAGSNTQVQYNALGLLSASANFTFNYLTNVLTIGGNIVSNSTVGGASATLLGANLTTGANTTAGNITGNWTLTSGSRLQATYADLAEYYEADDVYVWGTVLEFGGEKEVTLGTNETTRVAGVVSKNPAYVMNATCPGLLTAVALQGRVPCKVQGSVRKGDIMVSAGDGYAKACTAPVLGTVIGKALVDFDGIEGMVEIAVGRL